MKYVILIIVLLIIVFSLPVVLHKPKPRKVEEPIVEDEQLQLTSDLWGKETNRNYEKYDILFAKPLDLAISADVYFDKDFPFRECYTSFIEDGNPKYFRLKSKFENIGRNIIFKELESNGLLDFKKF